ncbi:MAG: hypothetical protein ACYCZF_06315 [Anaerolineae bacterium]
MRTKVANPRPTIQDIKRSARHLLSLGVQAAPRWRILRDILKTPATEFKYHFDRAFVVLVPSAVKLAAAQLEDGSWGRFHSQDTTSKQRFPTSEYAIERALALGLNNDQRVLKRAQDYIERHLRGEITWTDRVEKHDDPRLWPFFTAFISAGRLAQLAPNHPLLADKIAFMQALVKESFPNGVYDEAAEVHAQREMSGIPTRTHWSLLSNQYGVILLGDGQPLPTPLEDAWLTYIMYKPGGIYYVSNTSLDVIPPIQTKTFCNWLHAHELLSRFPRWHLQVNEMVNALWQQRNADGMWDLGPLSAKGPYFPLSDNRQVSTDRLVDGSVRILALLRRWVDSSAT